MGNSLPATKEVPQLLNTPNNVVQPKKSFPDRLKRFAKVNIITSLAKKGWKLRPGSRLRLALPGNQVSLQNVLQFLHKNRMRIASLRELSVSLDVREILPLLMTTVPIKKIVKSLGHRLSRLRNLERAEIGSSNMNAFCIEETLMESLTKMKKITSLSLGIPDNQNKINFIAKKLMYLKAITRLNLNFCVSNANVKPILNSLKYCSRLEVLRVNLEDCTVNAEVIAKLVEVIKKMKKLEYLIIHLENTSVEDEEVKLLYETIESHRNIQYFKIYLEGCSELSWWLRARIYAKENFSEMKPC